MYEWGLAKHVDTVLDTAIQQTYLFPPLHSLHYELMQAREQLKQPMRVAIVGLIKAGKSTMTNALLGEIVVAMGSIETTFNVNWFRYAEKKSLKVHFKDDSEPKTYSFEELSMLTQHAHENYNLLRSIKYIEVFFPNAMLHTFHLIDTPGLGSVDGEDSQNTLDFIYAHGNELNEATKGAAGQADAILYLFSQGVSTAGSSAIENFQGKALGSPTPINSIGVLTRVDVYWPDEQDPMVAGQRIVSRLQSDHPQIRRMLYSVMPVMGLLALGAQTLTSVNMETLVELAKLPEGRLKSLLRDANNFANKAYTDITITPIRRKCLLDCLGQYGIWRACYHIRAGVVDIQQLKNLLLHESGMPNLYQLILSHFGNRAFSIKLDTALRNIMTTAFLVKQHVQGKELDVLQAILRTCEELKTQQDSLKELRVLRAYYQGKLSLKTDEVQQLLHVTGEYGTAYWQRLSMKEEENISTEARLEQALALSEQFIRYWRQRAINQGFNRDTKYAIQVLIRAYERIAFHITEASHHLHFID